MCALRPSLTFFWGLNYLFLQSFAALFWIEFHFFLFGEGGCVFDKSTIFAEQSTLQSMPSAQRKHRKGRGSKRATSSRKTAKAVARGGKESDLLVRAPELAAEAAAEGVAEGLSLHGRGTLHGSAGSQQRLGQVFSSLGCLYFI